MKISREVKIGIMIVAGLAALFFGFNYLKGINMSAYADIFSRFEQKSPFAVLLRTIFQRLLPAEQLDKLFSDTAEKQYERTLLFSTLMTLMFEVVLRCSPSINHSYCTFQEFAVGKMRKTPCFQHPYIICVLYFSLVPRDY